MNVDPGLSLEALAAQRILILGLGREGLSTYEFLRKQFPNISLSAADESGLTNLEPPARSMLAEDIKLKLYSGEHYLSAVHDADIIFKTPGMAPMLSPLVAAEERGSRITSNSELFFTLCPGRTIGITGTKGKSTTSSLIHHVLQTKFDARLLGNIGVPPLSTLESSSAETIFVIELSSYQLATMRCSPNIAVLQNIVPEHLDHHGNFSAYVQAKSNILRFQSPEDFLLYNSDGATSTALAAESGCRKFAFGLNSSTENGCYLDGDQLIVSVQGQSEAIMSAAEVPLSGRFNLLNVMPSLILAKLVGIRASETSDSVKSFRPLEHRLEPVQQFRGVRFINDSIATVPDATIAAVTTFEQSPLVLIAGGFDRGLDFTALARELLQRNLRALILFPPTGDRIWEAIVALNPSNPPLRRRVETMEEAVDAAFETACPGDVVLLSPGSPSFGRFTDFQDRGRQFATAVHARCHAHGPA